MFKGWIDAIILTEKLPDYEYSPFTEPLQVENDPDMEFETNKSEKIQTMTLISMISLLILTRVISSP